MFNAKMAVKVCKFHIDHLKGWDLYILKSDIYYFSLSGFHNKNCLKNSQDFN